jgi:hypothetical protein
LRKFLAIQQGELPGSSKARLWSENLGLESAWGNPAHLFLISLHHILTKDHSFIPSSNASQMLPERSSIVYQLGGGLLGMIWSLLSQSSSTAVLSMNRSLTIHSQNEAKDEAIAHDIHLSVIDCKSFLAEP